MAYFLGIIKKLYPQTPHFSQNTYIRTIFFLEKTWLHSQGLQKYQSDCKSKVSVCNKKFYSTWYHNRWRIWVGWRWNRTRGTKVIIDI